MPHCEFMCLDCHKGFLKTLTATIIKKAESLVHTVASAEWDSESPCPIRPRERAYEKKIAHVPIYRSLSDSGR